MGKCVDETRLHAGSKIAAAVALTITLLPAVASGQRPASAGEPGSRVNPEFLEATHGVRAVAASAGIATKASAGFDATYYHLTLHVWFDPDRIDGETRVHGRVAEGTIDTLVLDLDSDVSVQTVSDASGTALPFLHDRDALRIDLPGVAGVGEPVAVVVRYVAPPEADAIPALRMGELDNGNRYAWTLSEPYGARQWWPGKDHPSDKADSVRVTISVPEPMQAVSNGLLRTEPASSGGRTTFDWFSGYPISTYLVSIAAGVYEYHEQTYVRPPDLAASYGPLSLPVVHYQYEGSYFYGDPRPGWGWQHVIDVLPIFERWFGPYPFPEEKYGHAQFTWGGGMEHQTISSMAGNTLGLVSHELAHQWYGDLITLETWPHLWLNEGFATYGELLYWEAVNETFNTDDDPNNDDPYGRVLSLEYGRARAAEGTLVVRDTSSFNTLFDPLLVYAKGAMVLHMLRAIVGDETFGEILRTYAGTEALRYGNATTADFHAVAETASGLDLDAFFGQWVTDGTGYPIYDVTWSFEETGDTYDVTVTVAQTQTEETSNVSVFEMPVTIEIQTLEAARRFTVQNDERTQEFHFQVVTQPIAVAFDPDRDILRHAAVRAVGSEAPPARPPVRAIAGVYPNPAREQVTVVFQGQAGTRPDFLALFDVLGRRVLRVPVPVETSVLELDAHDLPAGIYFVRLEADHEAQPVTIVILP